MFSGCNEPTEQWWGDNEEREEAERQHSFLEPPPRSLRGPPPPQWADERASLVRELRAEVLAEVRAELYGLVSEAADRHFAELPPPSAGDAAASPSSPPALTVVNLTAIAASGEPAAAEESKAPATPSVARTPTADDAKPLGDGAAGSPSPPPSPGEQALSARAAARAAEVEELAKDIDENLSSSFFCDTQMTLLYLADTLVRRKPVGWLVPAAAAGKACVTFVLIFLQVRKGALLLKAAA